MGISRYLITFNCHDCGYTTISYIDAVNFDPNIDNAHCFNCNKLMTVGSIRMDYPIEYSEEFIRMCLEAASRNVYDSYIYICLEDFEKIQRRD